MLEWKILKNNYHYCFFSLLQKEKDIELTARIGKELLSNNQKLEATVANLEAELKTANETITQLQHELIKKNELIQILTNDVDESSSEPGKFTSFTDLTILLAPIGILTLLRHDWH